MISNVKLSDHVSITSAPTVKELCRDMFTKTGITAFNASILFDNGCRSIVGSDAEFIIHSIQSDTLFKKYPNIRIPYTDCYLHRAIIDNQSVSCAFRKDLDLKLQMDRDKYNLGLKFSVLHQINVDYRIYATFYSDPNNEAIINYYFNHLDELQNFFYHFRDQASELMDKVKENPIIEPEGGPKRRGRKKRPLYTSEGKVNLTKKEIEICLNVCKGLTAKKIAAKLYHSPRTIECYLANIKKKYGARNIIQLGAKFYKEYGYLLKDYK